ncbi:TIGR03619 family F420-dependent LLM class oxidoreductase [Rhodococcus sp. AD45-ID]|uniref:LLM class F420-dependent oxidoreductase n=1 Tax=unclassified Rhodococcus (in: high G+C Gram-positive bacteria) TaxID=192944 RepID=UPI0005D2D969|nr:MULTISPECIES: LLM class F420-dependent oxidoreductase [unclassified Rhodococcus (in: high G+C Gram-positive bacteria)]KJF22800.1 Limonene 1,2-monooxygenase [Rhodococcus sp. AD45]PSR40360.1 TIGR03619 family F420-dependent LLM class oxidoreductase [Rhodococcus sp. AD45-ID]
MRIGISTPVVSVIPGRTADWELGAGIEEVAEVAQHADRRGFHFVTCSEHIGMPSDVWSPQLPNGRGTRYWDPLATLSYLAGKTERLRLVTNILVLGYHHPLEIAKRYGTLDRMSGGRVVLGLGVGTVEAEFKALGVPFEGRGPRADDAMRALRASLSQLEPEYHGEFYDFEGLIIDPHAIQPRVPLWVGGHSKRALRRAVTLGDGWMPGAPDMETLRTMLAGFPERPAGFEVICGADSLDPAAHPDQVEETLAEMDEAGVTMVPFRPVHRSLAHYLEQLDAMAALENFTPL